MCSLVVVGHSWVFSVQVGDELNTFCFSFSTFPTSHTAALFGFTVICFDHALFFVAVFNFFSTISWLYPLFNISKLHVIVVIIQSICILFLLSCFFNVFFIKLYLEFTFIICYLMTLFLRFLIQFFVIVFGILFVNVFMFFLIFVIISDFLYFLKKLLNFAGFLKYCFEVIRKFLINLSVIF